MIGFIVLRRLLPAVCAWIGLLAGTASAEPYLAVDQGQKCIVCHVNASGGGLRSAYGVHFARTGLAAFGLPDSLPTWSGAAGDLLRVGGDLRWSSSRVQVPGQPAQRSSRMEQVRFYGELRLPSDRVSLYVDELVGPGDSTTQEVNLRLHGESRLWHLKAGQFYLPFGWRLQDNTAFVRSVSGIGMATPERGLEAGLEFGDWSAQWAVTRPLRTTAGVSERQTSALVAWVQPSGRLGASAASSTTAAGKRQAWALFGGLRTGPVAWLAEVDMVSDTGYPEGRRRLRAGLLEANWKIARGHNLKLTGEYFDPDRRVAADHKARRSLVYELTPLPFVQIRLGVREHRGIPQSPIDNRRSSFVELHGLM